MRIRLKKRKILKLFNNYLNTNVNFFSQKIGKRRRQSTRLEHLGIPEEELLRQQQELFAKAREEQETIEQEEWIKIQNEAIQQQQFESSKV